MFKIANLKKLFSYNWSNAIKMAVPKGNNIEIPEGSHKDIQNGAIVSIIAAICAQIGIVGMAISIVAKTYGVFLGTGLTSYIMSGVVKESLGEWIIDIVTASIIPIITLIFINVMKKKKQNTWPYFILMILSLVLTFYMLYNCITYLTGFILSPLFAIIGLLSVFLEVLGASNTIVGCLDFCLYANGGSNNINTNFENNYNNPNGNMNNSMNNNMYNQPNNYSQMYNNQNNNVNNNMNGNTNTNMNNGSFVPGVENGTQNTISQNKFCGQCGNTVSASTMFCNRCGNKLQ